MAAQPVILILGAGPRVGNAVAKKFAEAGYAIAIVSRGAVSGKTPEGYHAIKADLSDHASVPSIFQNVKSEFGVAPSVVVYNAYAMTPLPEPDSPLSAPVAGLLSDLNVNTISAYVAAQEALKGFEELPNEARKAFIYTGN